MGLPGRKSELTREQMRAVTFTRSAELTWNGDVVRGSGNVNAGSGAFSVAARFPTLRGEPKDTTTPEELLAASHAVCFGIGVRSVIARHGGSATKVVVTATLTAEKGPEGIRLRRSHLTGTVEGLQGVDPSALSEIGRDAERECTISTALRGSVDISYDLKSSDVG
jgi:lipoyl-dependent peroxiredoxin